MFFFFAGGTSCPSFFWCKGMRLARIVQIRFVYRLIDGVNLGIITNGWRGWFYFEDFLFGGYEFLFVWVGFNIYPAVR